jgi:2-oxo-4-hydroxy-4-carboxy--5-ureidoimidazoline (OHCU) decarboxylase
VAVEDLFERGSPLADRLRREEPFADDATMIRRAREIAAELSESDQAATLAAHPAIGGDRTKMSAASRAEQGEDEVPELAALNAEYERRFGFRFVTFVNRRPKREVAEELRRRLGNGRREELAAGLKAVVEIAEDRVRRRST